MALLAAQARINRLLQQRDGKEALLQASACAKIAVNLLVYFPLHRAMSEASPVVGKGAQESARAPVSNRVGWIQVHHDRILALASLKSGELNFVSNLNAVELFYAQADDEFVMFQTSSGMRLSLAFAPGGAKLVLASVEAPCIMPLRWSALGSRGALRCLKHLGRLSVHESQGNWTPRWAAPESGITAANMCPFVPWTQGVPSSGADTSNLRQVLRCLHAVHVLSEP